MIWFINSLTAVLLFQQEILFILQRPVEQLSFPDCLNLLHTRQRLYLWHQAALFARLSARGTRVLQSFWSSPSFIHFLKKVDKQSSGTSLVHRGKSSKVVCTYDDMKYLKRLSTAEAWRGLSGDANCNNRTNKKRERVEAKTPEAFA